MEIRSHTIVRNLGDGLVLRHATPADIEPIASMQARIHAENPVHFDEGIVWWIRDLVSGKHPDFIIEDFFLVEDTIQHKIASSMCLLNHLWSYEGIPFAVGRPECVATEPEYRNRGLVRAQMDLAHQISLDRGQMVQAITGIPYYYRLFGYEMGAFDLEAGWNICEYHVPKLKDNTAEPYLFRPAVEADIAFLRQLYEHDCARNAITAIHPEADWLYQLQISPLNCERQLMAVIQDSSSTPVGMVIYSNELWGTGMPVMCLEIIPGHPWMKVCQSTLRFLWAEGKNLSTRLGMDFDKINLWLGREHPAYQALPDRLSIRHEPYGMYIRVPDLPAFLMHIRPALEKRLENSPVSGYTGELAVSLYKSSLKFTFECGKITCLEQTREVNMKAPASFPDLTFLKLVFGGKSLAELEDAFPEVIVEEYSDARPMLNALFPKKQSNILTMC